MSFSLFTQYFVSVEQVVQVHTHCCQAKVHFHAGGHHDRFVHVIGKVDFCLYICGYVFWETTTKKNVNSMDSRFNFFLLISNSLKYSFASPTPTSGNNNRLPLRSYFASTLIVGIKSPMSIRFLTKSRLTNYFTQLMFSNETKKQILLTFKTKWSPYMWANIDWFVIICFCLLWKILFLV